MDEEQMPKRKSAFDWPQKSPPARTPFGTAESEMADDGTPSEYKLEVLTPAPYDGPGGPSDPLYEDMIHQYYGPDITPNEARLMDGLPQVNPNIIYAD